MLLCGEPPWPDSNFSNLCETVLNGAFTFPDKLWSNVSMSAKRLVCRLLTVSPEKRITVEEALVHDWVTGLEGSPEMPVSSLVKCGEFAVPSTVKRTRSRDDEVPPVTNPLLTLMCKTTAKSPNLKTELFHSPAVIASNETTPVLTESGGGGGVRLAFADENDHNSPTRKLAFGFETPEKKKSSVKKKLKTGE
jgi:serine/threonine protein kinase